MDKKLSGIMPPIVTPFDNEELDLNALQANIERWNRTGLSGYLVLGSNGEAVYLNDTEKSQVLTAARETADPEKVLMAGTGCESTRATIQLTAHAADLGADCALVVTPAYFKSQMNPGRLEAHFRQVADSSPIPILLYNFPQSTGVNMSADLVAALAAHPNIAGIKDSSGNISQLTEILHLVPNDFAVLVGNAEVLYPALCLGAHGAILAVANVIPDICVQLYDSARSGKPARALDLQKKIGRLAALVTRIHGIGGLKAAMGMVGYQAGDVRSPLTMPSREAEEELSGELKKLVV